MGALEISSLWSGTYYDVRYLKISIYLADVLLSLYPSTIVHTI